MNRFEKMFNRDGLRFPKSMPKSKAFKAASAFRGPKELILTGYAVPIEDQGSKPWCAAYSATSYAESLLWRRNGYHKDIDPSPVYAYAKTIDGDPNGDGTYLECALQGILAQGLFDADKCKVKTFGSSFFNLGSDDGLVNVKYAIHKYGCCIAGFQITSEWFSPRGAVIRGDVKESEGGHAVEIVGYDEDGIIICNSWGSGWAKDGFVYMSNKAFREQFMYAAVLTHTLDD